MKRCLTCGLPQTFPGVKFNKQQECNYCLHHSLFKDRDSKIKIELSKRFVKLINNTKRGRHKYDCIVAYSGGKDSTFLLKYLKEKYDLKILAHLFDNGFISETTKKNIMKVTVKLGIDLKVSRPRFSEMKDIFTFALTETIPYPKEILSMMSQVCATCLGMVLGTTIYEAIKRKIPLIFTGFTPGQYPAISLENFFKVDSCVFLSEKVYRDDPLDVFKIMADPIREKLGGKVEKYFFKSQYMPEKTFIPKILFPFHALLRYSESKILNDITELGWEKPKDTDSCSTNCLLNTMGNYSSMKHNKYHPYIGELSYLVREGLMTRREAIKAEKIEVKSFAMKYGCKKLNIHFNSL
jgi:hypothetical protein